MTQIAFAGNDNSPWEALDMTTMLDNVDRSALAQLVLSCAMDEEREEGTAHYAGLEKGQGRLID